MSHGGKGDKHPAYNFKAKDYWLSIYHENCRREREEGLDPMNPSEVDHFTKPRTTHADTLASDNNHHTQGAAAYNSTEELWILSR